MEVTDKNFKDVLSQLPREFENARFFAIDTEFTGLRIDGQNNASKYDTPDMLYQMEKKRVESFIVIQYGIVAFYYNETTKRYSQQGYSFYVYPSELVRKCNFISQASSLRFLAENQFDFNTLFLHGIPYLRKNECKKLIQKNEEMEKRDLNILEQPLSPENLQFSSVELDAAISEIDRILLNGKKQEVKIPKCNSGARMFFQKEIFRRYKTKVFVTENEDETMTALVGLKDEEYVEKVKTKYKARKQKILDNVGFSDVIELLIRSGKLIVGHNLLLDLMYTIHQFIQPLPGTWNEFMELAHFLFPKVLDTKVLVSSKYFEDIKDTNLYSVQQFFEKCSDIPIVDDHKSDKSNNPVDVKKHNAAYDAYLTGVCYIAASNKLGPAAAATFENKVSIRKLVNVDQYISLCIPTKRPDRSCVFHLTIPKEWKRDDILNLFKPCGIPDIAWINDESAYVNFKPQNVAKVKSFLLHTDKEYRLRPFYDSDDNLDSYENSPTKIAQKRLKFEEDLGEVVERVQKK